MEWTKVSSALVSKGIRIGGVNVGTTTNWEKSSQEPCGEDLAGSVRFLGYHPGLWPAPCQ